MDLIGEASKQGQPIGERRDGEQSVNEVLMTLSFRSSFLFYIQNKIQQFTFKLTADHFPAEMCESRAN